MKHFITFQKKKGLHVDQMRNQTNEGIAHQINHELMKVGYMLSKELFSALASQNINTLTEVYTDLVKGITRVVGTDGYEPIYRNFPQSVLETPQMVLWIRAIVHYWSGGTWRPEDAAFIERETSLEVVNFKEVRLLTEGDYKGIFDAILYSGTSISKFDKEILDYAIESDTELLDINLGRIKFKETLAYVGRMMLDMNIDKLPTQNATDVLRLWAVYSGGDEGLKEKTRFKKPNGKQKTMLKNTLNACYNLEDSFKTYREMWLRVLFYLNPMASNNSVLYKNLFNYTDALRNTPKQLETFNAKVERLIRDKDIAIFDLLKPRMGVFTRRLDHLIRVFGKIAIDRYVENNITFLNATTAYNHFTDRDKVTEGRGAILASQSQSNLVTYEALAPLDTKLVGYIKSKLMGKLDTYKLSTLQGKKVFIDRPLFYTPLNQNNRASSLSLDSKVIGEAVPYNEGKTLRMYVHWEGRSDIDLSGFVITKENQVQKVGWNSNYAAGEYLVYSGDNTGYADKNAEYLDINTKKIPANVEWIITEARIYSGMRSYKAYNGKAHIGFMSVARPEANQHWQPKLLKNAKVLTSEAKTAYLMAYHVPTNNIVYLDMAMGENAVSSNDDALKMRMFLESFITLDDGADIKWDKLNQGHMIAMRATEIVDDPRQADIIFDERVTADEISSLLSQ